jgi:hypothetical protein
MSSSTFTVKFVSALRARNAEQFSRDTETAINNAERSMVALDKVMSEPAFAEIARKLVKGARQAQQHEDKLSFIAVKVLVKIVSCLSGIGQGRVSELDPYSRTIVANVMHANGLSNKAALVSLSKSIEFDETDQVYALKRKYNCSANTAGTQASSTRMMLKYLGIAEVNKGKRGDVITMLDNDRARALMSLFGEKVISEETVEQPAQQETTEEVSA